MRHAHVVLPALISLGACSEAPVSPGRPAPDAVGGPELAAIASTTNDIVPIDLTVFVPCANDGAGELVHAVGTIHQLLSTVINANGTITLRSHFQPQGLTGIGLTTGDKYNATGVTQTADKNITAPFPAVSKFIDNFRLIAAGPDNNLLVHEEGHLTINANGTVTVFVDHVSEECR